MSLAKHHRFSRRLEGPQSPATWPSGFALLPFLPDKRAQSVHRLLEAGYAAGGGSVADFEPWWSSLSTDDEYDPELVFTVFDPAGELAGVAICWTTAFVKDLVVARMHRRMGLATNLLRHTFSTFRGRGAAAVDLKVEAGNIGAISLYRSVGMKPTGGS